MAEATSSTFRTEQTKHQPRKDLLEIRDIIAGDTVAMDKWPIVTDRMVSSASDNRRIKKLLKDSQDHEAVLQSLEIWWQHGKDRPDLLDILRNLKLHSVADKIEEHMINMGLRGTQVRQSGLWFEVGDVVYNFTGREPELNSLHEKLTQARSTESSILNVVCTSGLGGIGKSSLAKKYAHKFRAFYGGNAVWVNGETDDSVRGSFTRLLKEHFGTSVDGQMTNGQIAQMVYGHFKYKKVLVIFDNIEDEAHFKLICPKITDPDSEIPYVLVTSRQSNLTPVEKNRLNLDVLDREEANQLIMSELPGTSKEDAVLLADKLERLPLAMQQAIAYITDVYLKDDSERVPKYINDFETLQERLLNDGRFKSTNDYTLTTFVTWQTTLERIKQKYGGMHAIQVLYMLAYLNPDNISLEFIQKLSPTWRKTYSGLVLRLRMLFRRNKVDVVKIDVDACLRILQKFSMINLTSGKVGIHRLVQQVIKLNLGEKDVSVMRTILDFLQLEFVEEKLTDHKRECMSHGLHLFPLQAKYTELMQNRSDYLDNLCYFLIAYGNYSDSIVVARNSSSIFESMRGKEHESTITMKCSLANANYLSDKNEDAMKILDEILPISESALGENHLLTMNILSSMACTQSAMGNHQKAIEIYDKIIPATVLKYGEEDGNVLVRKETKAIALYRLGKLDEALQLFEQGHEVRMKVFGAKDYRTLNTMNWIATVAHRKGQLTKALEMKQEVYIGFSATIGEMHPATLNVKRQIEAIESALADDVPNHSSQ